MLFIFHRLRISYYQPLRKWLEPDTDYLTKIHGQTCETAQLARTSNRPAPRPALYMDNHRTQKDRMVENTNSVIPISEKLIKKLLGQSPSRKCRWYIPAFCPPLSSLAQTAQQRIVLSGNSLTVAAKNNFAHFLL